MLALKLLALRALAAAADTGASSSDPCFADATNTFHAWIDPYASELGSWKFLECGDTPMPVLAVEKGVTYTFEQFDPSNWYHPLAFGTEPDDDEGGLRWGSKLRCLGARPWAEVEAERAREKAALAEEEARKGGG